jgi:calcineurin-like phosphoesterase family protein
MKKYFTSDLHIGHTNICNYTNRSKVTTKEDHTEWLIDLHNKQVNEGDLVYCLGDLSFTKYEKTKEVLSRMKGQKIIIKGNHDNEQHLNHLVRDGLVITWKHYDEILIENTKTCLMHFPIAAWHRQHHGSFHLYGHSHGAYTGPGKCLDVGLDSAYNIFGEHKYFTEEDIVNIMQKKEIYVAEKHRSDRSGD